MQSVQEKQQTKAAGSGMPGSKSNVGHVVQVIGPTVDVRFEAGHLPKILDAIVIKVNHYVTPAQAGVKSIPAEFTPSKEGAGMTLRGGNDEKIRLDRHGVRFFSGFFCGPGVRR